MCGVFGPGKLLGCGGGAFSFMRVSKILLGKMVWSTFRWLPAACSVRIWNLSIVFKFAPFFW